VKRSPELDLVAIGRKRDATGHAELLQYAQHDRGRGLGKTPLRIAAAKVPF
jgi:hypothetical protein